MDQQIVINVQKKQFHYSFEELIAINYYEDTKKN